MAMSEAEARRIILDNTKIFKEVSNKFSSAAYLVRKFFGDNDPSLTREPEAMNALKQALVTMHNGRSFTNDQVCIRLNETANAVWKACVYPGHIELADRQEGAEAVKFLKDLDELLTPNRFFETYLAHLPNPALTDELVEAAQVLAQTQKK